MGGFCGLWWAPLKRWLPSLISMLLWSSANLPNSRLCLLFGQIAWDWCCCCGFRLWAAVVGHNATPTCQREMEEVTFPTRETFIDSLESQTSLSIVTLLSFLYFLLMFLFMAALSQKDRFFFLNIIISIWPNKSTVLVFTPFVLRLLNWDHWAIYSKHQQQIPARNFSQAQVILSHMNGHYKKVPVKEWRKIRTVEPSTRYFFPLLSFLISFSWLWPDTFSIKV